MGIIPPSRHMILHNAIRKDDTSYVSVVGGFDTSDANNGIGSKLGPRNRLIQLLFHGTTLELICLNTQTSSSRLLKKIEGGSTTAWDDFPWTEVGNTIQEEVEESMEVMYLGDELILLQPRSEKDFENLFKCFEYLDSWSEATYSIRYLVWTSWYGIPLHAWNMKFF